MKTLTYIGTFSDVSLDAQEKIALHGGHLHREGGRWQIEFYRPISPATAIRMMDDLLGRDKLIQQVTGEIPVPDDAALGLDDDGELAMSTPDDPRTERQLHSAPLDLLAAAEKLRAIADDLQARSGFAEITVTIDADPAPDPAETADRIAQNAWRTALGRAADQVAAENAAAKIPAQATCDFCGKPSTGTAYAYSDHTYPMRSCGEHGYDFTPDSPTIPAAAVGHPDNVPHDGVGPGELRDGALGPRFKEAHDRFKANPPHDPTEQRDPLDAIMVELQAADSATMAHEYRMTLEKIAVIVRAAREQR